MLEQEPAFVAEHVDKAGEEIGGHDHQIRVAVTIHVGRGHVAEASAEILHVNRGRIQCAKLVR